MVEEPPLLHTKYRCPSLGRKSTLEGNLHG